MKRKATPTDEHSRDSLVGRARYPEKERQRILEVLSETMSVTATSRATGVPVNTINNWLRSAENAGLVERLRREHAGIRSVKAATLFDLAMEQLEDRLLNGEHNLSRTGEVVRMPVKARDVAVIAGIVADKAKVFSDIHMASGVQNSSIMPEDYLRVLENLASIRDELRRRTAIDVTSTAQIEITPETHAPSEESPSAKTQANP